MKSTFLIQRYIPEKDQAPHFERYELDLWDEATILDGLNEREPQVGETLLEQLCFFLSEIAPGLHLQHLKLIDEHLRQLEVHFTLTGLRIWNLSQKKRRVLRLHHHEFDKALGKLAALDTGLCFASHIYFCFVTGGLSGGRTVAKTYG